MTKNFMKLQCQIITINIIKIYIQFIVLSIYGKVFIIQKNNLKFSYDNRVIKKIIINVH